MGDIEKSYSGERVINTIATLIGLTAIVIGLTGLFGVIAFRWDGVALALSLANITLGSILFLSGVRGLWRC
jgi:hypothetical protein